MADDVTLLPVQPFASGRALNADLVASNGDLVHSYGLIEGSGYAKATASLIV